MSKTSSHGPLSKPIQHLSKLLHELDGAAYKHYQVLAGQCFDHQNFRLGFHHIQGSAGAFPASIIHLGLAPPFFKLPEACLANAARKMATADYLVRQFTKAAQKHTQPNRGTQGSGSYQPEVLPPQVLERNLVRFSAQEIEIRFRISLPGSRDNRILGHEADEMLTHELPRVVAELRQMAMGNFDLKNHCDGIEDMLALQSQLNRHGLVAFVADHALLPRQSGRSEAPLSPKGQRFNTPENLATYIRLPHAGRIRGLGIRKGVNVLVGGGFHGKSTLLNALAKAVYPHIPGDGREQVASHPETAFVCSEEGRAINQVNISGFMGQMPNEHDPRQFSTQNASGSTSQAAAIVEAVLAGAKLLLIDEDSSATNFLIRDQQMRQLVPEDPITPFFDRVQEIYQSYGVSTLIAVGSSSEYLGVADHVLAMRNYQPVQLTDQVSQLKLTQPQQPDQALIISDERRLAVNNFNPAYEAERLDKKIAIRIKPLRLHETLMEYGNQQLDLTPLRALVDAHQVMAIGYALLQAYRHFRDAGMTPTELAHVLNDLIETEGLQVLSRGAPSPLFLARPRRLELAGAINRLRNLKLQ